MNRIAAVVAGLSLAFVGTSATIAATINVPGDYALIQDAINASSHGDVIAIEAGTYYEANLNPGGKAITIQGTLNEDGSLATTIDAQQGGRVFGMWSGEGDDTVLNDLVITGGQTSYFGGGIMCWDSSPTIKGCWITGNTTTDYGGGGISCETNSNPTIIGCTISGNDAAVDGGGGIYCEDSNPTITNSSICGNNPDQIYGDYNDAGGNTVADECPEEDCPADADGNGFVDVIDLLAVIGEWGICSGEDCPADIDGSGTVDATDLLDVISAWGTCP